MIGQPVQKLLLDPGKLAGNDLVVVRLFVEREREQFVLDAEFGGQEGVDEGDVVVNPADLEDLLPAETELLCPTSLSR